jgi:MFS family permease
MSIQSVVIILPSISRDLNIPQTRQQWIVSAYALTSGSFLLLFGKLADVYGKRLMFILGSLWFGATSLGVAFSPVEICLYAMRALQGVVSITLVPNGDGYANVEKGCGGLRTNRNWHYRVYDSTWSCKELFVCILFRRSSNWAAIGKLAGTVTLLIPCRVPTDHVVKGGIISDYANWKAVFFVIAGASFSISFMAIFVIPKEQLRNSTDAPRASGVDWIGAFLFTSGLLLILIGLSEGVSQGWKTPSIIAILVISVIFLVSFLLWQHRLEQKSHEPLMKVSTFKNARFSFAMIIVFLFSAGFSNFLIYSTYL